MCYTTFELFLWPTHVINSGKWTEAQVALTTQPWIHRLERGGRSLLHALAARGLDQLCRLLAFAAREEGGAGQEIPTADLIARFQRGQPRAFELLYDRFRHYVYRIALFITRDEADAEDAVQETFMDVLKALPHYDLNGPARFETWLYRVTVNRCRSRHRRKVLPSEEWDAVEERLERLPLPDLGGDPEGTFLDRERATALWRAVDALTEEHRTVLLLRYQQDLSYEEIAQVLSINVGTVKSRLFNAHRKLKLGLEGMQS